MVISTVNQVIYNGDGVTTAWPYTFRIIDATDIKLAIIDADETETEITADYYVDTVNNTVYYPGYAPGAEPPEEDQPPVLPAGKKLLIYRQLPITQEKDLGDKWPFYVIELGLDKLTMILQDIWDWLGRCLCVSKGQAYEAGDDFDPTVPLEAGKVICGNAAGDGFEAREALMEVNGAWDGEGRQIHSVADPTGDQDAVTKNYVDTLTDGQFMKLQPDGTGWEARNLPISNVAGPALIKDAANKDYVDRILSGYTGQGDRFVFFDNVEQMQLAKPVPSQMAVTLGYWDVNDGGAGVYTIRDKGADTPDGGSIIEIPGTDYVAELITDGPVNVRQFGAKGDGVTDDGDALDNALKFASSAKHAVYIPAGLFICKKTLNSTAEIFGIGEESTIRWTVSQTDGLIITEAYCHDVHFEMENNFAGNLLRAVGSDSYAKPTKLKLEHISFASNNATFVGTALKIEMTNTYGGFFNDIKLKRASIYLDDATQYSEYGIVFAVTSGAWATGCILNDIVCDFIAKKPMTILGYSNNASTDIFLINSQIQCKHITGFKHEYLTRIAYIGRAKIINCKIWDYDSSFVDDMVIYYSCSDLITVLSPLYDKYALAGVDPFYIEGGVNVYGASQKLYNSQLSDSGLFVGLLDSLNLGSDSSKLVPIFIKAETVSWFKVLSVTLWTSFDYSADSRGGDALLNIEFLQHIYNKNIRYQNNVTTIEPIIYKIKKYVEGVVIWVRGGRTVHLCLQSEGKAVVGTGMTVTDIESSTTETLSLLTTANYDPAPFSKNPTIIGSYVIDSNTILTTSNTGSNAAPVSGTYKVGDIVYNAAPTAGGKVGWVCVTAGTPGTWKAFGDIEA